MTTSTTPHIEGTCTSGFEGVRDAFATNFRDHGEVGAAVCVLLDGRPVVDLWGGWANGEQTRPWERDTIVNVWSATKGVSAVCAHILADRGELDFDAPVARYWPEFGQAGKELLPVKYILTHQAGLAAIEQDLPEGVALDWERMVHLIEQQSPNWEPGTAVGYHAMTYGWLLGEVVRRISGKPIGRFFHDEVAEPLGLDFFIGVPAAEQARIAEFLYPDGIPGPTPTWAHPSFLDPRSLGSRACALASPPLNGHVNSPEWRAAEFPAANGHGNARALARLYGALARGGELDGVRILSEAAVERARQFQAESQGDYVMRSDIPATSRRSLGFMLPVPEMGDARGPRSFGHGGVGGQLGSADPDTRMGFGYTSNLMWGGRLEAADPRAQNLVRAVYASL